MNIGFVGTGKIASAVITGIFKSNLIYKKIIISPRNKEIAKKLKKKFNSIKTILIVIHGSGRNADEYLCTIMSLLDKNNNEDNKENKDSVLIIAPKFPVEIDLLNSNSNSKSKSKIKNTKSKSKSIPKPNKEPSSIDDVNNVLYWSDDGPIGVKGSSHTWRYVLLLILVDTCCMICCCRYVEK